MNVDATSKFGTANLLECHFSLITHALMK